MEVRPLSYNAFVEEYGGTVEDFTLYSLGYWLQQNADKQGEQHYIKLKGHYDENSKTS